VEQFGVFIPKIDKLLIAFKSSWQITILPSDL
jgi:hypothetical protein